MSQQSEAERTRALRDRPHPANALRVSQGEGQARRTEPADVDAAALEELDGTVMTDPLLTPEALAAIQALLEAAHRAGGPGARARTARGWAAVVRAPAVVACSWCHTGNRVEPGDLKVYCWQCYHRADVDRSRCDCAACAERRAAAASSLRGRVNGAAPESRRSRRDDRGARAPGRRPLEMGRGVSAIDARAIRCGQGLDGAAARGARAAVREMVVRRGSVRAIAASCRSRCESSTCQ